VIAATQEEWPAARPALERLCQCYWYPLYAHVRRRGYNADDAKDLTQEFFASLLRHESLANARKDQGRFRSVLLGALNHFLADQRDRARALKRGGGVPPVEWDSLEAEQRFALEPATEETPDRLFDRRWATTVMERALAALQSEQVANGKSAQFELLRQFLGREVEPGEYEMLSPQLHLSTNAMAAAVRRLRLRCRELALAEVMNTVTDPAQAEAELRQLFQ
jgi:RNA polymerase sigma-70 factor (ECF subfamily)